MAVEAPRITVRAERLRLGDLRLLEVNARYMRPETFRALVENLRRDGALTQAPFACRDEDGAWLVLSGNHRVKAAIEALGPDHVDTVLVTDDPLTPQQRVAIQLSHNAIVGEDDPATLRALYESLDEIDWKAYSGLDDKALALLAPVELPPLSEPNLAFQPVTLLFLPDEVERVEAAWAEARALIGREPVWLARMAEYDAALDALDGAGKAHGVKNVATALLLVLAVFRAHLTDLQDGYLDEAGEARHRGSVPIASLFGGHDMPASAAVVVARAISAMVDRSEVPEHERWRALERWAAAYFVPAAGMRLRTDSARIAGWKRVKALGVLAISPDGARPASFGPDIGVIPPAEVGDVWRVRRDGQVAYGLTCPNPSCVEGVHVWTHALDCGLAGTSGHPSCWTWNGSPETGDLTASPSLYASPEQGGCGWHGWLCHGEMTS